MPLCDIISDFCSLMPNTVEENQSIVYNSSAFAELYNHNHKLGLCDESLRVVVFSKRFYSLCK